MSLAQLQPQLVPSILLLIPSWSVFSIMIDPQLFKGKLVWHFLHLNTITSVGRGSFNLLLSSSRFNRNVVDERVVSNVSIVENVEDVFTLNWEMDMEIMF